MSRSERWRWRDLGIRSPGDVSLPDGSEDPADAESIELLVRVLERADRTFNIAARDELARLAGGASLTQLVNNLQAIADPQRIRHRAATMFALPDGMQPTPEQVERASLALRAEALEPLARPDFARRLMELRLQHRRPQRDSFRPVNPHTIETLIKNYCRLECTLERCPSTGGIDSSEVLCKLEESLNWNSTWVWQTLQDLDPHLVPEDRAQLLALANAASLPQLIGRLQALGDPQHAKDRAAAMFALAEEDQPTAGQLLQARFSLERELLDSIDSRLFKRLAELRGKYLEDL